MEYASRGDLYDYISERPRLSERDARHFFRQIVSALHYCHQVSAHPLDLVLWSGRGGCLWGAEAGTLRKASGLSAQGMLLPLALFSRPWKSLELSWYLYPNVPVLNSDSYVF